MPKKISFEKKLEALEEISDKIDSAETPLDTAISLYRDGVKLARELNETLRAYEEEVQILQAETEESPNG